jgi:hypothetical protein
MQSIVGHPIDTIKVLQQTKQPFHTNILHYYRGISYPTAFNLLATGLSFDLNSRIKEQTGSHYSSGFITGGILTPIIYLFDIGKIHYQTKPTELLSPTKFLKGRGIVATGLRETIGTGIYMGVYFQFEERIGPFVSGGLAGLVCWTSTYPLDVIKTRQMSKNLTFYESYKIKDLWKGFSACAIRSVLANAIGFWSYRKTIDLLSR